MSRGTDDFAVVHHRDAAHDSAHRPAFQLPAVVQAVIGVGPEFRGIYDPFAVEVHERNVSVAADGNVTLGGREVENLRRVRREQACDSLKRQTPLVVPLG